MKQTGILLALLLFCAFALCAPNIGYAQDDSSQRAAHKAAAQNDANAADQKKQDAEQSQAKNQQSQQDKKDDSAQKQGSGQPQEKSAEDAAREAAMMAAGQMTPTQAMQLLDAQKGEEQVFRLSPTNRQSSQGRPYKNW